MFKKGKVATLLDGSFGSSGKGSLEEWLVIQNEVDFVCNTYGIQASHTVITDSGEKYVYKVLNSCAHVHDRFKAMYIGAGAIISIQTLLEEIAMSGIPREKVRISPLAAVVTDLDADYEKGIVGFDGEDSSHDGTIKTGSTCSGVGAAAARKMMRRPTAKIARDFADVIGDMLCTVEDEIIDRLDNGEKGLLCLAQGFPLSLNSQFYPHTTSRNVTVAKGFDDCGIPVKYAGDVWINFRTLPIRIHSKKYISNRTEGIKITGISGNKIWLADDRLITIDDVVSNRLSGVSFVVYSDDGTNDETKIGIRSHNVDPSHELNRLWEELAGGVNSDFVYYEQYDGKHMYWDEVISGEADFTTIESNSGDFYPDQDEMTWEEVTQLSGSDKPLMECTTLTKLPRRIATFSTDNLVQAIRWNQTTCKTYISINFINYIDWSTYRKTTFDGVCTDKVMNWLRNNILNHMSDDVILHLLRTGERTSDVIDVINHI